MKGLAIFLAIVMLILPFGNIIEADEEKATAVITFYGVGREREIRKEMPVNEAKEIMGKMYEMDVDYVLSHLGIEMLYDDSNISNYMCLVFGIAKGIALYTLDLSFFFIALAITGNAFGAAILTAIFAAITHLLPFRLATPAMLIGVDTGTIKTIGIKGMQSIGDEGDMMLLGFIGVVINFFLPTGEISPLFIAGYALAALPNPFG